MNTLLWIAQMLLAGMFLFAGFSKLFAFAGQNRDWQTRSIFGGGGMPRWLAAAIALLEIAGAVCVLLPFDLWPPDIFLRMATAVLALLAIIALICHGRRKEPAAPIVALFLLAMFVIVGRWPR
ncbi:MAG: DoxX family protein [Terracidiphilus sp.]|jgi:uncharacterized membrane protein YphA (DoxX/SURF4 family)